MHSCTVCLGTWTLQGARVHEALQFARGLLHPCFSFYICAAQVFGPCEFGCFFGVEVSNLAWGLWVLRFGVWGLGIWSSGLGCLEFRAVSFWLFAFQFRICSFAWVQGSRFRFVVKFRSLGFNDLGCRVL